jgi:hypothetical protein
VKKYSITDGMWRMRHTHTDNTSKNGMFVWLESGFQPETVDDGRRKAFAFSP